MNKSIVIVLVIVALIFLQVNFKILPFSFGSDVSGRGESINELELKNCYSTASCKTMLINDGMPVNFLEETNSVIQCEDNKCILRKK